GLRLRTSRRRFSASTPTKSCARSARPEVSASACAHRLPSAYCGSCGREHARLAERTSNAAALAYRGRRQRIDVGRNVDDDRTACRQRPLECRRNIRRFFDADAERAHVLGQLSEVHLVVGPQLTRLLGWRTAIGAVETAFRLIAAAVIVDDRHRIYFPAHRRLDFRDVVPETGVAGENHNG